MDLEKLRMAADDLVDSGYSYKDMVRLMKAALIQSAVAKYGSNTKTAKALRMNRMTVWRMSGKDGAASTGGPTNSTLAG